jgi:hypothetical protein
LAIDPKEFIVLVTLELTMWLSGPKVSSLTSTTKVASVLVGRAETTTQGVPAGLRAAPLYREAVIASVAAPGPPIWPNFLPVVALLFTVASFWWVYLRRGGLEATSPTTYSAIATDEEVLITLPLVVFNKGAAAIVVEDLRLTVAGRTLRWRCIRSSVDPAYGDVVDLPAPFAIPGRTAHRVFAEFSESPTRWTPELGRAYDAQVEVRTRGRWRPLLDFEWWAPRNDLDAYVAHGNEPA